MKGRLTEDVEEENINDFSAIGALTVRYVTCVARMYEREWARNEIIGKRMTSQKVIASGP